MTAWMKLRTRAAVDVLAERERQIHGEGFDAAHDDQEIGGALAYAAACYALNSRPDNAYWRKTVLEDLWPWARKWWKPKTPRQDLVRAAALLIAEIERLDRAEEKALAMGSSSPMTDSFAGGDYGGPGGAGDTGWDG